MYVALSSDSTCTNDLRSPKEGYETLVLTSIAPPPLPFEVINQDNNIQYNIHRAGKMTWDVLFQSYERFLLLIIHR